MQNLTIVNHHLGIQSNAGEVVVLSLRLRSNREHGSIETFRHSIGRETQGNWSEQSRGNHVGTLIVDKAATSAFQGSGVTEPTTDNIVDGSLQHQVENATAGKGRRKKKKGKKGKTRTALVTIKLGDFMVETGNGPNSADCNPGLRKIFTYEQKKSTVERGKGRHADMS